ncbi:hypothetical protein ACH5RR_005490 [Cinchona calisaya]|uniref:Uncharacterized protein n=1 Tax=Cinchona calisaya TaxID=153742 RepID=A0ABD3ALC6_9GENT
MSFVSNLLSPLTINKILSNTSKCIQEFKKKELLVSVTLKEIEISRLKILKHKMIEKERKNGFVVLKLFIKKLQAHLQLSQFRRPPDPHCLEFGEELKEMVPEDVKEGHFAVFAVKTETPQRFIVELQFLTNPAFFEVA